MSTIEVPEERESGGGFIHAERDGEVVVLRMTDGENRFNATTIGAINAALDEIEGDEQPTAVVLTGEGKFFSNGLDLEWMSQQTPDEIQAHVGRVQALFARLLAFPTATVAAINGHAFAGGGMLALATDQRVMRVDRGFFCLPEVDINIPFTPGMSALIRSRLTPAVAHEAMLTGRRYGGEDALAGGIVDAAVAEDRVLAEAVERARPLAGKGRPTVQAIKRELYGEVLAKLALPIAGGI